MAITISFSTLFPRSWEDVIRVQMQIDSEGGASRLYKNTFDAAKQIAQTGGVRGLYAGLSAAYLRQWLYGSCRIGLYSQGTQDGGC